MSTESGQTFKFIIRLSENRNKIFQYLHEANSFTVLVYNKNCSWVGTAWVKTAFILGVVPFYCGQHTHLCSIYSMPSNNP